MLPWVGLEVQSNLSSGLHKLSYLKMAAIRYAPVTTPGKSILLKDGNQFSNGTLIALQCRYYTGRVGVDINVERETECVR